jgi:transcriptional regulator with XRE-family HTH domain
MTIDETTQQTADNIRNIREKQGFTQVALAKKAGIDSNYYAKIERGEIKPGADKYKKIVKALGVKSSDIFPF